EVSVDELIEECERELKPLHEARRIDFVRSPTLSAGSPITVRADARMLRQTLLNLLRNAAEAIPENQEDGAVIIETGIETEHGKSWALISIRDNGPGIPAADLQKIFIPFFTTKSKGHGV